MNPVKIVLGSGLWLILVAGCAERTERNVTMESPPPKIETATFALG